MPKKQVDLRFDMVVGFLSSKKNNDKVSTMRKVGDKWIKIDKKIENVFNVNKVLKARKGLKKMSNGNLRVFAFNRGRMNWKDIDNHLDLLEERDGYVTDVLIVDYLGIMKETHPGQTKKERSTENCIGLKEMSGVRNMIVFTAMQGNRTAMQAKTFKSHMIADDIDVVFNSDLILAICQTPVEAQENKHRIYVANYRHGPQHASVGVVRDLNIGQIALDSFEMKDFDKIEAEEEEKIAGVDF
jgi:hypothetical protein